jgi:aryl-alcohol dehydrogenase-like predicted oxidoreductase
MRRIRSFLDKLAPIAMDNGATLTQLGIRWVIDRPGIAVALLGATSPEQIRYDGKAMDISISDADMAAIDVLLADLEKELEIGVTTA